MMEWPRLRTWIVVGVAIVLVVGACATGGPKIIRFAGKGSMAGEVAFNHGKHSGEFEEGGYMLACDRCHHGIWQEMGKPTKRCRTCHGKNSTTPPPMEEAAHTQCMGCHEDLLREDPEKQVPRSCPDCHVFKEPGTEGGEAESEGK